LGAFAPETGELLLAVTQHFVEMDVFALKLAVLLLVTQSSKVHLIYFFGQVLNLILALVLLVRL
jgi:hypothetical protein